MTDKADNPLRSLALSWPALAAMAVTFWGVLMARPSLDSERPVEKEGIPAPPPLEGQVAARLWQDPFAAAWRQFDEATTPPDLPTIKLPTIKAVFDHRPVPANSTVPQQEGGSGGTLFLCSLLETDNSVETVESRRRERYATIAALTTAGYVPASAETLWYFGAPKESDNPIVKGFVNAGLQLPPDWQVDLDVGQVVPFEWFIPAPDITKGGASVAHGAYDGVCVLWVPTSLRFSRLLASLCYLRNAIKQQCQSKGVPQATIAFSGRLFSTRVQELADEDKEAGTVNDKSIPLDALTDSTLYLTYSTAPYVRDATFSHTTKLKPAFLIGDDDELAALLIQEFRNRGLEPGTAGCRIAVIAESDSGYGRGFSKLLETAIDRNRPSGSHFITPYGYLRGLDGRLPTDSEAPRDAATAKGAIDHASEGTAQTNRATARQAEGDPQIDYLPRLANRMKEESDGAPYRVIGIVGTDFYDKLLLLKALRGPFPDALFFTTDLDSRLLQPGDYPHTHNLLIASHYGLAVHPDLQKRNPPFRSGYDTATYLAVLQMVGFTDPGKPRITDLHYDPDKKTMQFGNQPIVPGLYEVGRHGAYELTMPVDDRINPISTRSSPWIIQDYRWLWFLVMGALVAVGLALLFGPCRAFFATVGEIGRFRWLRGKATWRDGASLHGWVLFGILLVMAMMVLLYVSHVRQDEQPVAFFDGISVWPTECLRLAAVMVAFGYLLHARRHLKQRNQTIYNDYKLAASKAAVEKNPFSMWWWKPPKPPPAQTPLSDVWKQFVSYGDGRQRFWRILALFLLCAGLVFLLWLVFLPAFPQARGLLARSVNGLMMLAAGVALVGLMLFIIDTTVLCHRFVAYLWDAKIEWPPEALVEQAKSRHLDRDADLYQPKGDESFPYAPATNKKALEHWLLIRLVADVTDFVAHSISLPFIVLLMLLLAQNHVFADWQWNIPFLVVAFLSAGGALISAGLLQYSARRARKTARDTLDRLIRERVGILNDDVRARYEKIRAEIDDMDSGAFASLASNPIVVAVLIPLAGGGGLAVLQALLPYFR